MKILLPLDGSEVSLQAVRQVISMVRQGLQAEVVLANVQEPAHLYEMVMAADPALIARASAQAGAKALKAGEALLRHAAIPYATEVATGDPAHTLIDIVERFACDMVVMGARDKGSLRSALLGSVSHEVLHAAKVPVMLIKPSEAPESEPEFEETV
ncbi:Nucleotide-binding universal stress protein, UspA family [Rhodoferax sp. OV413]|uniref:universal stress protein n=1 Tax=Rhodoferax sp. OV413 TaxID=1855285 RepID=UPI000891DDD0|nr:universal stress protein [Rhodoferax sp. OV413]SDP23617.1 Nucleotide-binding universal stress protein, UspA family [Rhodoferax sp. OV413]